MLFKTLLLCPLFQAPFPPARSPCPRPPQPSDRLRAQHPQLLWLLDDLLFPAHRAVRLHAPVFIVAPPRSGSTTLHRAVAADDRRFCAPCAVELVLPFLPVMALVHWARSRPAVYRTLVALQAAVNAVMGLSLSEVARRHPMGPFDSEEDDLCLLVHHVTRRAAKA